MAKNQLKTSYLISFSIQALLIYQDKTSGNYILSVTMTSMAGEIGVVPRAGASL